MYQLLMDMLKSFARNSKKKQAIFHNLVDSLKLLIAHAYDLSVELWEFFVEEVAAKLVLLPYSGGFLSLFLIYRQFNWQIRHMAHRIRL